MRTSSSSACNQTRDLRSIRRRYRSEELFDYMNRSVGANLADTDGKQPVQEGILRFGCLEARQCTKVGSGWRSVVTNALERHVDEGAVISLQRDAQVELDDAVGACDRPI